MKAANTAAEVAAWLESRGFTVDAIEADGEPHEPPKLTEAPPADEAAPAPEKRRTHRWVKLRIHVYICRCCGAGKVNSQRGGEWITTYHLPSGKSIVSRHTPACEIGPKTAGALAKYAAEIAAAPARKPRAAEEQVSA